MKVGIDARLFGPHVGGGGIGRYVEELVKCLAQQSYGHRYVLFVKPEARKFVPSASHFTIREADVHWYGIREQLVMPRLIDREGLDLVHVPHWNVALGMRTPFLTTIHDLILLEEPRSARATTLPAPLYTLKYAGYKTVLSHAVRKSQAIITPSAYVKGSLLTRFPHLESEQVHVIHEGVTPLTSVTDTLPPALADQPYFLCVGNAYPHKNLESVIHAFSFFTQEHPDVRLVFAGRQDRFRDRLREEVEDVGIAADRVVFLDAPSDAMLAALYAHTALYLYPSRSEGFGLPPLEAMAAGAPVAAARSSSLPEILGEHVSYFAPDDIERMVELMEEAIISPASAATLEAARAYTHRYTWNDMAAKTAALYTTCSR